MSLIMVRYAGWLTRRETRPEPAAVWHCPEAAVSLLSPPKSGANPPMEMEGDSVHVYP